MIPNHIKISNIKSNIIDFISKNNYSKIGIFTLLPGLPLTYFLIGPVEMNCLNLGAMGLAIKMVIIQIISVNVQLFYISKYLNLNFIKYFSHQFILIGFFLFTAFITNMTINYYFEDTKIIYILFLNLFIYSILIILIALLKPKLFGLKLSLPAESESDPIMKPPSFVSPKYSPALFSVLLPKTAFHNSLPLGFTLTM